MPSALSGRELWHFTLPKSVPFSVIKDINRRYLLSGTEAFSYNSTSFKLLEQPQSRVVEMHIFHPEPNGSNFTPLNMGVSRSFTVSRCRNSERPEARKSSHATGNSPYLLQPKSRPQQPEGLRLRYFPIGCGDDGVNAETSIIPVEQSKFKFPAKIDMDHWTVELRETSNGGYTPMPERHSKIMTIAHDSLASDQPRKRQKKHHGAYLEDQVSVSKSQHSKPHRRK